MEAPLRRQNVIQDQENTYVGKSKSNVGHPTKRVGLVARGALGDMNTNVQILRDVNVGKVAVAAAEYEKKATSNRAPLRSNYGYVQSKVDTGLATKPAQPTARAPLRREESTTNMTARAVARSKAIIKESQNKIRAKEPSAILPAKKVNQVVKKPIKLQSVKDIKGKQNVNVIKPTLKESTESLGKLKLGDSQTQNQLLLTSEVSLPDDIEDIDSADKNSPLLMSIYIKDMYKYLTQLELEYPIEEDYLKKQTVITGKMRATLIDWLVEVQHQFNLILETFQLTVGIIDRYLQVVPNVRRDQLQLIGVTAMYIASKYEEIYAPAVGDFVYVTANAYTKDDVFKCERDILSKLGFCLARPIPLSFLRRFVKAAHGSPTHHHLAKYLVDLCLVDYSMAHYRPSELAAAAMCLSIHLISKKKLKEVWTPTLAYYSEYTLEHIEPIIRKIAKVVTNVENSKCQAVYHKYQDKSLAHVSNLPHLKGDAIHVLAKASNSDC